MIPRMMPWLDATKPQFVTEAYVVCPPAAMIVDPTGAIWTLGLQERTGYDIRRCNLEAAGWEFNVLRNSKWTGEWAAKIVLKDGRVSIFGDYGKSRWKKWTGNGFI